MAWMNSFFIKNYFINAEFFNKGAAGLFLVLAKENWDILFKLNSQIPK